MRRQSSSALQPFNVEEDGLAPEGILEANTVEGLVADTEILMGIIFSNLNEGTTVPMADSAAAH